MKYSKRDLLEMCVQDIEHAQTSQVRQLAITNYIALMRLE